MKKQLTAEQKLRNLIRKQILEFSDSEFTPLKNENNYRKTIHGIGKNCNSILNNSGGLNVEDIEAFIASVRTELNRMEIALKSNK